MSVCLSFYFKAYQSVSGLETSTRVSQYFFIKCPYQRRTSRNYAVERMQVSIRYISFFGLFVRLSKSSEMHI